VKRILSIAAVTMLAAGCHNNPPATQSSANPGTLTPLPAAAPVQAQPVAYEQSPAPAGGAIDTSTPIAASDASAQVALGGGSYTVQHGDTLYHIALKHYGDGKQWKKIAAANPGVDATHLKVGQTLVLP
jgi:5'-nucleotidase / UDP-sugar diphosphatase